MLNITIQKQPELKTLSYADMRKAKGLYQCASVSPDSYFLSIPEEDLVLIILSNVVAKAIGWEAFRFVRCTDVITVEFKNV